MSDSHSLAVAVAGAGGPLGRRVCARLLDNPRVGSVIGVDLRPDPGLAGLRYVGDDVGELDLAPLLDEVDVLVHLVSVAPAPGEASPGAGGALATRRLLDAAAGAGVGRLVLMSSAMVYGAWPDNPVPLTEASLLRPNPEFGFAVVKAEQERLAAEWAEAHPHVAVITLRPVVGLAEDHEGWVFRSLRSTANLSADREVPMQFLHLDDLADAVELSVVGDLSGVYNVAPPGWITTGTALELLGRTPGVKLPEPLQERLSRWWRRYRRASADPGVLAYVRHPWVVAADRLREAGWNPEFTSEQALVSGREVPPWGMLDSRRRQQIALGGAVLGGLGVIWAVVALIRRLRRGRRERL
ncbi:NAD-dependent epimerase/dehydratase family protein [Candidatus Poriferisocius sp.]|uniref:NAD-dependent epimerase/dehydratase family protein n=1 Tax=Candidatus Poriferisocius sp. TaxID=3101276 RepID=UPI003B5C23DB